MIDQGMKPNYSANQLKYGTGLILLMIMLFMSGGNTKAQNLVGCYANQDSTGSYFLVLLPQGNYRYYVRTSLNQEVASMGTWWQDKQNLFTQTTASTIRDQLAVSRLVEGSIKQLSIQSNGNLVNDSTVYRPVSCTQVTDTINEFFIDPNQHKQT